MNITREKCCYVYCRACFVSLSASVMTPSSNGLGWVGLGWVGLGWVGLGRDFLISIRLGWVGLGQPVDGLGWIGSHKMDPCTTL